MDAIGPDVADIAKAGAATHAYLMDGPIAPHQHADPGVPDDLTEEI